jgi:hypothetical protein
VQPSFDLWRAEGYEVPAFAYPFGSRTTQLDDAIGKQVSVIRSLHYTYEDGPSSPCPE